MNKQEKTAFLRAGGTLIRTGKDKNGRHIIKAKTSAKDWHELRDFDNEEVAKTTFDSLIKYYPTLYKADQ